MKWKQLYWVLVVFLLKVSVLVLEVFELVLMELKKERMEVSYWVIKLCLGQHLDSEVDELKYKVEKGRDKEDKGNFLKEYFAKLTKEEQLNSISFTRNQEKCLDECYEYVI